MKSDYNYFKSETLCANFTNDYKNDFKNIMLDVKFYK